MLYVKAFHIIAMTAWFAGLFYLPRLFVYHASCQDEIGNQRFKTMEYKLYRYIMNPAMVITIALGLWMLIDYAWSAYQAMWWFKIKLFLVVLLIGFHHACGNIVKTFAKNNNTRTEKFYRIFNEVPTIFLIVIVVLTIVKPL